MSQPENDLISFDDLFAALGPSSPAPGGGSSGTKKASTERSQSDEGDILDLLGSSQGGALSGDPLDSLTQLFNESSAPKEEPEEEIDLISALGFSKPPTRGAVHRMSAEERKARDTQREAQIREQQIRSQQWQRELAQQEERKRQKALQDAGETQRWQPGQEDIVADDITVAEGSAAPATVSGQAAPAEVAAAADTAERKSPFAAEDTQIAQPAFLDRMDESKESQQGAEPTPSTQTQGAPIRGKYSDLPMYNAGQPAAAAAPQEAQARQASSEQPTQAAASTAQASQEAQAQPAAQPAEMAQQRPEQAQVRSDQAPSQPQDAQQPAVAHAEAQEAQQAPEASKPTAVSSLQESQATQKIMPLGASQRLREDIPASSTEVDGAQAAVASTLERAEEKGSSEAADEMPHAAMPPKPSLIKPLSTSSSSSPADSGYMPVVAPAQERPFAPIQGGKEINIDQPSSSSKGNIVGIILIIIAIVCAVLTVLLFTGTINYSTFSGALQQQPHSSQATSSSSSSSSSHASSASSTGATDAVYKYVVRGTDGGTYEATETAHFGETGLLEESTIDIEVADPEVANELMEQLTEEFGSSVQSATTNDKGVNIVVKVDRDDLDLNSYTELLSNSMAEFEVVDSGK